MERCKRNEDNVLGPVCDYFYNDSFKMAKELLGLKWGESLIDSIDKFEMNYCPGCGGYIGKGKEV